MKDSEVGNRPFPLPQLYDIKLTWAPNSPGQPLPPGSPVTPWINKITFIEIINNNGKNKDCFNKIRRTRMPVKSQSAGFLFFLLRLTFLIM